MKARDIIKILEAAGFVLVASQGRRKRRGNHLKFRHPDGRWTVLSHGDKDFDKEYVRQVARQAGININWS